MLSDLSERSFRNLVSFLSKDLKKIHRDKNCRATELFSDSFIKGLITKEVIKLKTGQIRSHVLTDKTIKVLRLKR